MTDSPYLEALARVLRRKLAAGEARPDEPIMLTMDRLMPGWRTDTDSGTKRQAGA